MANFEDCVRFANQHMICSVATCDREQPRVRMLGMWFADTRGFYFSTVKTKKIFQELTANRRAEGAFMPRHEARLAKRVQRTSER